MYFVEGKSVRVEGSSVGGISVSAIAAGMPLLQNIIALLFYEYKLDAFAILHTEKCQQNLVWRLFWNNV